MLGYNQRRVTRIASGKVSVTYITIFGRSSTSLLTIGIQAMRIDFLWEMGKAMTKARVMIPQRA